MTKKQHKMTTTTKTKAITISDNLIICIIYIKILSDYNKNENTHIRI